MRPDCVVRESFMPLILSTSLLVPSHALADSVCDLALKSGAFNVSDYSKTSRMMLRKRDDACKSEYSSQAEAVSSGQQSGGSLGYGTFSLSASDAKQTSSGKYSIADSKFCKASAEELDSFTSVSAKEQVADIALSAWSSCIGSVETNKLFVQYKVNPDGSGVTGMIFWRIARGAVGRITGITSSSKVRGLDCKIGQKQVNIDQTVDIPFDRTEIAFACNKDTKVSVSISLTTSQGDQEWIMLPSVDELKRVSLEGTSDAVAALRRQIASLSGSVTKLTQENAELKRGLETSIPSFSARLQEMDGRLTAATTRAARSNVYFAQQGAPCPPGTQRRGTIGVIMQDSDYATGNLGGGGPHNAPGWRWTHPVLCTQ